MAIDMIWCMIRVTIKYGNGVVALLVTIDNKNTIAHIQ